MLIASTTIHLVETPPLEVKLQTSQFQLRDQTMNGKLKQLAHEVKQGQVTVIKMLEDTFAQGYFAG